MSNSQIILWIGSPTPDSGEEALFAALAGYSVQVASGIPDLLHAIESQATQAAAIDLVIVNLPAGEWRAADVLEQIQRAGGSVPVIVGDRSGTCSEAVRLGRMGAHQFFGQTFDVEEALSCIDLALEDRRCATAGSREAGVGIEPWRKLLVGQSQGMRQVTETIRLIARRRCTILISGETGTGKEVVARAIHMASDRSTQQFVAVNCSAIPEPLLESELFGHVRGAFTGAHQSRAGLFEQAHNGTILLDEIADLPLELQAKLLRVLQEREFQRLGSAEIVRVDVRVIAASNIDLQEAVRQGTFREDLYYRLNVVPLEMPALRSRLGDVPVLANHFIQKVCHAESIPVKKIRPDTLDRLRRYFWPGNVRQLENAIESAVILSGDRDTLYPGDFSFPTAVDAKPDIGLIPVVPDHGLDYERTINLFERSILSQTLRKTRGNKKQAAEMLGLKRTTLSAK